MCFPCACLWVPGRANMPSSLPPFCACVQPRWKSPPMWPSGVGSRQPCPRESALRRAAISGNINALPPHHVPTGRSVRVFICANPDGKSVSVTPPPPSLPSYPPLLPPPPLPLPLLKPVHPHSDTMLSSISPYSSCLEPYSGLKRISG